MDMKGFDPAGSLDYLMALSLLVRAYSTVQTHEELVDVLGGQNLTDISDHPVFVQMDAADPLPPGYSQRIHQFQDATRGRGLVEAAFRGAELVNVRLQLFFRGWRGGSRARRFLTSELIPAMEIFFGPPVETARFHATFRARGMLALTRYVPRTPSVSTYLTHEDYA